MNYDIVDVSRSAEIKAQLIEYSKSCSFQGVGSYLSELLLYDEFEDHEKVFVAISKNEIFGFVALLKECCCIDNEDNTPWLDFLFVDEVYQNRHIGLALIEAVCSYAKQLGYSDIFLCTVSHKEFYEKNGFFIKYTTFNYNNKHNEKPIFVMQKTI